MKPAHEKQSYGTMIFVRVAIVMDVVTHLKKALTIAIRYSAVREQVGNVKTLFNYESK